MGGHATDRRSSRLCRHRPRRLPRLRPPARARAGGARRARREADPQRPHDRPHRAGAASSTSSATSRTCATAGLRVVEIDKDGSAVAPLDDPSAAPPRDAGADLRAAAEQTIAAMRSGADVVYQATFFDGTWRGHADFLLRRDHVAGEADSAFGPWHYEVADTKLARHVKASAILQICSYVEQLTAIQGVQPESLHVVLGGRERPTDTLRVEDYMAYYRRVRADFEAAVGLRGDVAAARLSAGRDVPRAGRALRRVPLGRHVQGAAARRRRPEPRRGRLVAPAPRAQGARASRRDAGSPVLPLPMDPKLEGVGAGALERIQEQARIQVAVGGPARGAVGAPAARSRRGRQPRPRPRPARPARAEPGRPVPRPRGRPVRARRRHRLPVRHPRAADARDRPALGRIRRAAGPGVPRDLGHRRRRPGHLGRREGGVRADDRPHHRAPRPRPGAPRLPLRRLRADGPRAARAAPRDARGGGRPPAAGRRARRPVQGRPAGHPRRRRELLDQADRAAVRAPARGRAQGRRQQHRRVRDVAGAGRRVAGRGRRARSSPRSRATTATTS